MSTPHKATPEQWEFTERQATQRNHTAQLLLELRDRIADLEDDATEHSKSAHFCFEAIIGRIEALEAAANSSAGLTGSNHPAKPDSSPAPAGGLVERVRQAVWNEDPHAAILAISAWIEERHHADSLVHTAWEAARWLREEVERG